MDIEEFIGKYKEGKTRKVAEDIEIIYERLKSGETQETIAQEYKISISEVSKVLLNYCHYYNKSKIIKRSHNSKLTQEDIQAIIEEYDNEEVRIEDLAGKYHVSNSTIRWHLRGIIKKEPIQEENTEPEQEENTELEQQEGTVLKQEIVPRVIEMYESGKSIQYIEDTLSIENKDIRFILMNYMDIKDRKMSKQSIEILQKLGYDIELIKKVAQDRNIQIKEQYLKPSQEDEVQL